MSNKDVFELAEKRTGHAIGTKYEFQPIDNLAFEPPEESRSSNVDKNRQILEIKYEDFKKGKNPFLEEDDVADEPIDKFQYVSLDDASEPANATSELEYRFSAPSDKNYPQELFSRVYIEHMLDYKFPSRLVVGSIVFGSLLNFSMVILQVAGIIVQSPLYFIGSGIWTGCFMLFIQSTIFSLIYNKNSNIVTGINNMYTQGIIINVILLIINIFALKDTCIGLKVVNDKLCSEKDFAGFNASILVFGIANIVLSVIFKRALRTNLSQVRISIKHNKDMSQANEAFDNSLIDSNDPDGLF